MVINTDSALENKDMVTGDMAILKIPGGGGGHLPGFGYTLQNGLTEMWLYKLEKRGLSQAQELPEGGLSEGHFLLGL